MLDPRELAESVVGRVLDDPNCPLGDKLVAGFIKATESLQQQHAEDERLLQEAHAAMSLGPVRGICSWCGLELLGDADPQARIKQHLYECRNHPMRVVEEYAAALKAVLDIRTRQYRAALQGTIRDTKTEGEFMKAAFRLEKAQDRIERPT